MSEIPNDPPAPDQPPSREATPSRDERLAAKLRENLHRRKLQARGMADQPGALPKSPGKS